MYIYKGFTKQGDKSNSYDVLAAQKKFKFYLFNDLVLVGRASLPTIASISFGIYIYIYIYVCILIYIYNVYI